MVTDVLTLFAIVHCHVDSPRVEFCGYSNPHPSENKIHLRIQMYGKLNRNRKTKSSQIMPSTSEPSAEMRKRDRTCPSACQVVWSLTKIFLDSCTIVPTEPLSGATPRSHSHGRCLIFVRKLFQCSLLTILQPSIAIAYHDDPQNMPRLWTHSATPLRTWISSLPPSAKRTTATSALATTRRMWNPSWITNVLHRWPRRARSDVPRSRRATQRHAGKLLRLLLVVPCELAFFCLCPPFACFFSWIHSSALIRPSFFFSS